MQLTLYIQPCLILIHAKFSFRLDVARTTHSGAHLHFLKIVNLIGSCLNDLEQLVAAEFLRQTLESVVADLQLSQAAALIEC